MALDKKFVGDLPQKGTHKHYKLRYDKLEERDRKRLVTALDESAVALNDTYSILSHAVHAFREGELKAGTIGEVLKILAGDLGPAQGIQGCTSCIGTAIVRIEDLLRDVKALKEMIESHEDKWERSGN